MAQWAVNVTDFRDRDWENPTEIREQLRAIADAGAEIHFVDCASRAEENLAIVEIVFLLGYSEASTFYRAFKRWTGVSPARWRADRLPAMAPAAA